MAAALSFMLLEQNIGNFTVEESAWGKTLLVRTAPTVAAERSR